ncbi:MAG: hypothetical protein WBQ18_13380 [Solirubrobacteraceae bacterium]
MLRGGAELQIGDERVTLDPETLVRVGPGVTRRLYPGPRSYPRAQREGHTAVLAPSVTDP